MSMRIFNEVAAGKLTPEQGAELLMREDERNRPWYARPDTGFLGLFVRALFAAVRAVSAIFGTKEKP